MSNQPTHGPPKPLVCLFGMAVGVVIGSSQLLLLFTTSFIAFSTMDFWRSVQASNKQSKADSNPE